MRAQPRAGVDHDVDPPLVALLGEPRATIVRILKQGERSAPELAEDLGITDVAVRRHLALLSEEGLIADRTVKQEIGRPVARYRLTTRGERLFPQRYVEMVGDLLDYLSDEGDGVNGFLRWRQDREAEQYAEAIDAGDVPGRLHQLVDALNAAGYEAAIAEDGDAFVLTQTHCAVLDAAKDHPQICAHEAAVFRRVLGDVRVSRRETLANGDAACVCTVEQCC